jgi:hypothetical protein
LDEDLDRVSEQESTFCVSLWGAARELEETLKSAGSTVTMFDIAMAA